MKYDSQKKYKMIIYRSGQARYILQKYTIKKAVGMFDWPIIGEKIVGKELPPTKFRKKPLIVYLDPKDYKIL